MLSLFLLLACRVTPFIIFSCFSNALFPFYELYTLPGASWYFQLYIFPIAGNQFRSVTHHSTQIYFLSLIWLITLRIVTFILYWCLYFYYYNNYFYAHSEVILLNTIKAKELLQGYGLWLHWLCLCKDFWILCSEEGRLLKLVIPKMVG